VDPGRRHLAASGVVGAFHKTWVDFWGPRMEYILYNAVRTLLDAPDASLLDLPRLLTDDQYRRRMLDSVADPRVKEFWLKEFAAYPPHSRVEAL
jgi:hypothetical protein